MVRRVDTGAQGGPAEGLGLVDVPPEAQHLTPYDEAHLSTYLRLLDADAEGADWREAAAIVLGLDTDAEPIRAREVHARHLARAKWVRDEGYRDLLKPGSE